MRRYSKFLDKICALCEDNIAIVLRLESKGLCEECRRIKNGGSGKYQSEYERLLYEYAIRNSRNIAARNGLGLDYPDLQIVIQKLCLE